MSRNIRSLYVRCIGNSCREGPHGASENRYVVIRGLWARRESRTMGIVCCTTCRKSIPEELTKFIFYLTSTRSPAELGSTRLCLPSLSPLRASRIQKNAMQKRPPDRQTVDFPLSHLHTKNFLYWWYIVRLQAPATTHTLGGDSSLHLGKDAPARAAIPAIILARHNERLPP
jgi:hypothetical protein